MVLWFDWLRSSNSCGAWWVQRPARRGDSATPVSTSSLHSRRAACPSLDFCSRMSALRLSLMRLPSMARTCHDLIALAEFVPSFLHAMLGDLGIWQQASVPGKSSTNAPNRPGEPPTQINFADLRNRVRLPIISRAFFRPRVA